MSFEHITKCLANTLSSDTNTRIAAELKLSELLALPEAGLVLSQLVLAQNVEMPLRQMTGIALRKYLRERWSPYFSHFKGAATPVEIKSQIREAIFNGLSDPSLKIRSLCAQMMSVIATCDWPDEYPELLSSLVTLLSSNAPDSVHGAMQVFVEFIKDDMTEDQILPVLRQLLPVLLTILGSTEQHSALTRARVISVFRQCISTLYMVKDQHSQAVKEAIDSVLPVWLEAFKVLLNISAGQDISSNNWDEIAVRIQIFKTMETIHSLFSRLLTPHLTDLLTSSLNHLRSLLSTYSRYYLSNAESVPPSSEGGSIDLPQLICPTLDFFAAVSRGGRAKGWFGEENLRSLIALVFSYVQMAEEDEQNWANDASAFAAHEEDSIQSYSVRVAGFDLLACLFERQPLRVATAFQLNMTQIVDTSRQARDAGSDDWWKPLEAALAALGSQAEALLDFLEEEEIMGRAKPISVDYLLSDVVPSILNLSGHQYLQGRGFVFVSQYAKALPRGLAGQYIEASVQVIESSEAGIPVKISAVKAIHNFCMGVTDTTLVSYVSRIATDLVPFLAATSEDALSLSLETLSAILDVDRGKWMTTEVANSLVLAALEVWMKNNKDPIFLSLLSEILGSLAKSPTPGVYETVVKQALPPLCHAIETSPQPWVVGTAIELAQSLVNSAPESGLGEGFFALLAPGLFRALHSTGFVDALQSGIHCLTAIIRKDCGQLLAWTDNTGRSGLGNVLTVIAFSLQDRDESGGLVIGDLIIHLLRKAGDAILPVLPELLQAMIGRMKTAKTATFIQSLVIPFAFLIHNQPDTVLSLLEQTTIEDRSGLDIVMQTWCENAETFQGFWHSRISTVTLCQLYASERPSLQHLMVKGDIILKPETRNIIMTRSRTKNMPHEFTLIPFPNKALKILLHDLQTGGDAATISARGNFDVDSDDGDEEWAEVEDLPLVGIPETMAQLSEMLAHDRRLAFDNDDILNGPDDEDLQNDPVSRIDLQAHLVSFIRECSARNTSNFSAIVEQLTVEEMLVVHKVLGEQ